MRFFQYISGNSGRKAEVLKLMAQVLEFDEEMQQKVTMHALKMHQFLILARHRWDYPAGAGLHGCQDRKRIPQMKPRFGVFCVFICAVVTFFYC